MSNRLSRGEQGSILTEVLIALLLLALTALPLYSVMVVAERLERRSERFAQMLTLARQVMELKGTAMKADPGQADSRLPAGVAIPDGFRCQVTVQDAADPAGLPLKEVSVIVWDQANARPVEAGGGAETAPSEISAAETPSAAGSKCALAMLVALPDEAR
ncbi:hypothetical protein HM1_0263 [Heliomicrobium modesticaldum Ice1]|uniref:Prepilin-type N-terminal cleavage/methylation domain-containing protein n=1 Tax=Heliobacterium modesticaldum (strain ATCC 51547 / Ice1) TaxID=498761 RepID=B0TEG3_HELMI|nr:hypothetical protein [Heliomicrobium modesticaldum]ABZ82882.1 hypothetical protein HM1_0263 [Heliomicrobium modesticaldum Ice1]